MIPLKENLRFKIIDYGCDNYKIAVCLRETILRIPLGLSFSPQELMEEQQHIHIAGFIDKELCVTCALVPEGNALKMQRIAVKADLQRKGLGTALLEFCESYAKNNHYKSIYCYSR